ncbi:hypothetical protein BD413DRAFT_204094 [Trametes elegans]|nr:hypothetical protein BD413DRAFT_204094 [Trametes elegans]
MVVLPRSSASADPGSEAGQITSPKVASRTVVGMVLGIRERHPVPRQMGIADELCAQCVSSRLFSATSCCRAPVEGRAPPRRLAAPAALPPLPQILTFLRSPPSLSSPSVDDSSASFVPHNPPPSTRKALRVCRTAFHAGGRCARSISLLLSP